jgi:modulator of FtsH protease HflK
MFASFFKQLGVKWVQYFPNSFPILNGRRPDDGPPDLDQLWRDFNQRLSRLLDKSGNNGNNNNNNGGNNNSQPEMAGAGIGIIVLIVLLLWMVYSCTFVVQEGQTGVVTTFGKLSRVTMSGFNMRLPYPIQDHEIVNVSQVRTVEVGYRGTSKNKQPKEALMLTDDENIIEIQFAVQYKLKDPVHWLFKNRDQEETLRQVAETAIREIVGKSKMDFVLYEGREKVALDVNQLMQQILDRYESGAQVTNVTMQGVQPPEQVQSAFDDAVKAGQDRERLKNEGQAYTNDVVPKARGTAFSQVKDAEAYRARIVDTATGDAARFKQVVAEYQKAPGVTRDRMYIDTMQQVFSNVTKVMVDSKAGNNLISLPLDKIMGQAAAQQNDTVRAGAGAATTPAAAAPDNTDLRRDTRSRDGRDRESR